MIQKISLYSNIFLGALCIIFFLNWRHSTEKESDYKAILNKEMEIRYKGEDGLEHVKKELEVIKRGNNLKEDPEWKSLIEDVKGLKAKNLVSATKVSSTSEYRTTITVKDSVRFDSVKLKCFEPINEKFLSISGCQDNLKIQTRDSLAIALFKERKKILFLRIGEKQYFSDIKNYNPNSKITYNRSVIVKRK